MADTGVTLWYLLVDQSHTILSAITSIDVDKTLSVDKLKRTIKEKHDYRDVDPTRFNVYRPNISVNDAKDREKFKALVRTSMNPATKADEGDDIQDLSLFEKEVLLVELPQATLHYVLVDHSHRILARVAEVTVDNTRTVRELIETIKEKEQVYCRNAKQLTIYRSKIPLHDDDEESWESLQSDVEAFFKAKPKPCEVQKIKSIPVEVILVVELPAPGLEIWYHLFDGQRVIVPGGCVQLENDANSINDVKRAIIEVNSSLIPGVIHNQLEVYMCREGIDFNDKEQLHAQVMKATKDKTHDLRLTTRSKISAGEGLLLVKVPGVIRLDTDCRVRYILVDWEKNRIGTSVVSAYLVADFKIAVKAAWSNELRHVDAGKLIVWRRTNLNPFATEPPESISFTDDTAIVLEDMTILESECLPNGEQLIVQIPDNDRTKMDSDSRMASLFQGLRLDDFQQKRLQVFQDADKEPSPSKGAYVKLFRKLQEKNPIYNGRPAENSGVPVGLYHDAFNTFQAHLDRRDLPRSPSIFYKNVAKILDCFADIYADETSRSGKIMPLLTSILGHPIDVVTQPGVSSDGVIKVSCGEFAAFPAIVEMKNEIGTGNSDPYNQAGLAYRKYWADKKHESMVPFCHFPSFLIAIAGPWIMIAGAIYLDNFIVEPLTEYIWLGGAPLGGDSRRVTKAARLFAALRAGISELKSYYEGLDMRRMLSRFPFITSFGIDESEMRWEYCFKPYAEKLVYEAKLEDGRQVIVKFASTYAEDAHKSLAKEGYAPKLYYVSKQLYGGRRMIVMDRVIGKRLGDMERLTPSQYSALEKALRLLHAGPESIVHGDLRGPNIIIKAEEVGMGEGMEGKSREVMLIDFDECGKAGEGRYPADLNMDVGWPNGVKQESVMQVAHDIQMLDKLKQL